MRIPSIVLLLAGVLTGSASSPATAAPPGLPALQVGATSGKATVPSLFFTVQRPTPFGNLFAGQPKVGVKVPSRPKAPSLGQQPARPTSLEPVVVCGMTVIPADPKIDAAIRHPIPEDGPAFTMRTMQPSVCRQ